MTTNESTTETTNTNRNPKPTDNQNSPLTLVLGASGKTGRRVADRLAQNGVWK